MLLPRAVLMTCLVCTCSDADAFPPYPQISWEAPVEKKAECIQKGKSNQVGSLGPAGGRCTLFLLRPSAGLGPRVPVFQALRVIDASLSSDGVFQLHPLPAAI